LLKLAENTNILIVTQYVNQSINLKIWLYLFWFPFIMYIIILFLSPFVPFLLGLIVSILLENGAEVFSRNRKKQTPLSLAHGTTHIKYSTIYLLVSKTLWFLFLADFQNQ
jgi:hypothetical protein